jgi:type I restriction enzyme, S subunit
VIKHRFRTILGPIPDSWDVVSLRAVLARSSSGDWGDERGDVAVPVLRSTNFTDHMQLDFGDVAQRWFSVDQASRFDIRADDFLLERSGGGPNQPVGRLVPAEADLPGYGYSNFVQLLRIDSYQMAPEFVGWCLFELHRGGIIERLQHQTTQMRNLDFRDYLTIRIPRPPRDIQERIAGRISAADLAMRRVDNEIRAARQLRATLIEQLLTGLTLNKAGDGQLTPLGALPATWEVVPVSAIAGIEAGVTLNTDRAPRRRPYRYLTVINVQRGSITLGEPRYLELWESEIPRKLLKAEDILVVEGHANNHEIGRAALVPELEADFTYQNHLFRVRVSDPSMDPRFLSYALNSAYARRYWAAVCNTSSGLNTINRRQLRRLLVPKPSREEQLEILSIIGAAERALSDLVRKREALAVLLRALLQNLLTGRVRVSEVANAAEVAVV